MSIPEVLLYPFQDRQPPQPQQQVLPIGEPSLDPEQNPGELDVTKAAIRVLSENFDADINCLAGDACRMDDHRVYRKIDSFALFTPSEAPGEQPALKGFMHINCYIRPEVDQVVQDLGPYHSFWIFIPAIVSNAHQTHQELAQREQDFRSNPSSLERGGNQTANIERAALQALADNFDGDIDCLAGDACQVDGHKIQELIQSIVVLDPNDHDLKGFMHTDCFVRVDAAAIEALGAFSLYAIKAQYTKLLTNQEYTTPQDRQYVVKTMSDISQGRGPSVEAYRRNIPRSGRGNCIIL